MTDLQHAKEAFERYLDGYDWENDKVKLKIVHTYGVVECSSSKHRRLSVPRQERRGWITGCRILRTFMTLILM